jgi:indolepyruvate ferredoxin oxidoreductase beta subunit
MVKLNEKACTIQIVGVGGQGALTVSKIIGAAAIEKDIRIIVSEIHGMAQRGGVVQTTIRLGETISPLPFASDITVLVGFEPLEAYRARDQITPETVVVVSTDPIRPISVSSHGHKYPDTAMILEDLGKNTNCLFSLSAREKAMEAGNERVTNVVMLGALVGTEALPFTYEEMRKAVEASVPPKSLEANLKAFDLGYDQVHEKK